MSKLRKAARRNKKTSVLTEHVFGKVTLSVCSFFQSLIMFSILVFLGVQKCKEEEKKNLQHRIPQKRNPCNLDNLHILSDLDHQHSSPVLCLCFPSCFFCHAVRSTQWRFHSFLYRFGFTSSYVFCLLICEHSWSRTFRSPLCVPHLKTQRRSFSRQFHASQFTNSSERSAKDTLRIPSKGGVAPKQTNPPVLILKVGLLKD